MKKLFLLFLLLGTINCLYSQEQESASPTKNNQIETIFTKPTKVRGYVGSITNFTTLNGESTYINGTHAAGIFNDHFILGFYRMDLENNILSNNSNYLGSELYFYHKGLWLGYIFIPKRVMHFNTNVQIGKGKLEIYDDIFDNWITDDAIIVLNPSLEIEFNIVKFFRIGIGANYRFTFDVDQINGYKDDDFTDLGAFINLKFGWFN